MKVRMKMNVGLRRTNSSSRSSPTISPPILRMTTRRVASLLLKNTHVASCVSWVTSDSRRCPVARTLPDNPLVLGIYYIYFRKATPICSCRYASSLSSLFIIIAPLGHRDVVIIFSLSSLRKVQSRLVVFFFEMIIRKWTTFRFGDELLNVWRK